MKRALLFLLPVVVVILTSCAVIFYDDDYHRHRAYSFHVELEVRTCGSCHSPYAYDHDPGCYQCH
jgi:hypothetical protein